MQSCCKSSQKFWAPQQAPALKRHLLVCRFAEGDVAMMLTLLQSCGLQLRSDDSISMKVGLLQSAEHGLMDLHTHSCLEVVALPQSLLAPQFLKNMPYCSDVAAVSWVESLSACTSIVQPCLQNTQSKPCHAHIHGCLLRAFMTRNTSSVHVRLVFLETMKGASPADCMYRTSWWQSMPGQQRQVRKGR